MNLQQLSNLIDTWGGDHFDPQNRWSEEVVFVDADGNEHGILSLTWDSRRDRWALCGQDPEGDDD